MPPGRRSAPATKPPPTRHRRGGAPTDGAPRSPRGCPSTPAGSAGTFSANQVRASSRNACSAGVNDKSISKNSRPQPPVQTASGDDPGRFVGSKYTMVTNQSLCSITRSETGRRGRGRKRPEATGRLREEGFVRRFRAAVASAIMESMISWQPGRLSMLPTT